MIFGLLQKKKKIDGVFKFIVDINYNGGTYNAYCWQMLKRSTCILNCLPYGVICHIIPNNWKKLQ